MSPLHMGLLNLYWDTSNFHTFFIIYHLSVFPLARKMHRLLFSPEMFSLVIYFPFVSCDGLLGFFFFLLGSQNGHAGAPCLLDKHSTLQYAPAPNFRNLKKSF